MFSRYVQCCKAFSTMLCFRLVNYGCFGTGTCTKYLCCCNSIYGTKPDQSNPLANTGGGSMPTAFLLLHLII
ncbi:hypothetical protein NC652_026986 [Populus alba x Populus x berolinensis]|nr:hypothetical protein NC652_026986 [Populus alba x Populus x berolinensis]